ncbi:ABC transporter ATP-binding protein [Dyadobacter jiangsuensis]|uniref:ABC-2 type transport system ATP-binding protein n=1 Tax=Dyadobacter jiangsuensis TaxID=1591085 RepID=A0A2P8FII2_9BACT|nr:ABC transporter ATP-binding protein [Dyadobacter jiangsuensis]PSL21520.1 ABC-2 type transport system ATP-binding protein [Dyadobacter jiangsuensis]
MENPVIDLKGLTKCYGSLKAVDDLNLKVEKGEIFGLLGPNGAGKTTTILMMLGLTEPTSGKALVCGIDATTNPILVKRKVGYMPDSVGFYENMTALENLVYTGKLNGVPGNEAHRRGLDLLDLVGLGDSANKRTSVFSRGMKQRLGLAEVLIKRPEVIILDEPTLGIDPAGVKEFLDLIRQLSREQGLTVLLSSHHLHQVQMVCDRVGIFAAGKMQMEGNIHKLSQALFADDSYSVSITVREPLPASWEHSDGLRNIRDVQGLRITENLVQIACSPDATPDIVRFFVAKGLDVMGVHKREFGLDEIYQKYFDNHLIEHNADEKSRSIFKRYINKK